ncbi:uncharacterized protein LOC5568315 [Aedes aegypti]|uniref:Uncharacterized protein n=1 Tax=Aedes aegypti TaxID=7159 RepID=A0A6I8TED5_AEDAE|nr:uncharacterized protein LOC5568315 [Aedes aegypti]
MYFKSCEMDESFDRIVLTLAKRFAKYSKYFYVESGIAIHKDFHNYIAIFHQIESMESQLTIVEHRFSKEDYRHVTSRDDIFAKLQQSLPEGVQPPVHTKHVLILANHRETITEDDVEVVDQKELHMEYVSGHSQVLQNALRAARLDQEFGAQNIYEILLTHENSEKPLKELLISEKSEKSISKGTYYRLDPIAKNAMPLMELYESPRGTELGVFLIREAPRNYPLITLIQPVRELSDITAQTRFIVSDAVSFEAVCERCPTARCHEVIFREDYGLVYWQRSSGPTNDLAPFLSTAGVDHYELCIPPSHWLNVIYAERTSGKTEFLRFLEKEFRRVKPFGWVRMVDGEELRGIVELTVQDGLIKLGGVHTDRELEVLKIFMKGKQDMLLLIDHVDHLGNELVRFLKGLEELEGAVKVWIAAGPKTRNTIESNFPIVRHEFPVLDESEQATYLKIKIPNAPNDQVENMLDSARKQNLYDADGHPITHPYTGNVFHLQLLADVGLTEDQSKYEPELLEAFVMKHCPADRLEEIEKRCYETVVNDHCDPEVKHLCLYSTVVEYLAARYLAKHHEYVSLEVLRNHKYLGNLLDRIITKNCPLSRSVLNKNIDEVRANLDQYETAIDVLQRTPLHLCHEALLIAEVLITAVGINLEACCLLSNYTPLQMADERQDWQLVNLLINNGASTNFQNLRLRMMPSADLTKVLNDCIMYNFPDVIRWILDNRPDIRITQSTIYTISVYEEFDQELAFRILELAYDQDLPSREAPYRYMWGNTALHLAAYSNNLKLCRFLVEKLQFDVDAVDYSRNTVLHEATDVAVVKYLRSKSAKNIDQDTPMDEGESNEAPQDPQESVFFRACYSDNLDLVRNEVEREGWDPLKQEHGTYGLIRAAAWGSLPIVQYLYDAGFRDHLDLEDDTHYTALATAVRFENLEVVKFLVEKGADTSKIFDTPSNRELLKFMIDTFDFKPTVNFEGLAKLTIEELRETQFDYYTKDEYGKLFLHYYVEFHDNPEVLRFLLTKYDNVDLECEETGRTALHEALAAHNPKFVDVLLEAGADYRKRCSKSGQSVLHFAALAQDRRHLDLFLAKPDMDIDDRNNEGETIMFLLQAGSFALYQYLVDRYGLNVNAQDNLGQTKMHKAIISQSYFNLQDLEVLLREVGANQNITDHTGRLPLHYAVEYDNSKAVRLMQRYGYLGLHVKDQDGKSPWMLAEELNRDDILEIFRSL